MSESIPGWAGPLVGVALGAAVGAYSSFKVEGELKPMFVAVGAVAGVLAGGIIWLIDLIRSPSRRKKRDWDLDEDDEDDDRPQRRKSRRG